MKLITVMLKSGARISLKAKDWAVGTNFISLADEAGKHVATFPVEAIYGLWFKDSQDALKVTLAREGNLQS
jgi:hypothetical protein